MCFRVTKTRPVGGLAPCVLAFMVLIFRIMEYRRDHYINVRFSDEELEKLMLRMRLSGYNNRSKYIRDSILSTRVRRRNLSRNDANLAKQIDMLRVELKRIGVNYNQRVKSLNTLAKLRDKNGRVIVNAADIDHDMMQMKRMMDGMVQKVNEIYAQVVEQ